MPTSTILDIGTDQRSRFRTVMPVYELFQTFQAGNGYTLPVGTGTLSQNTTDAGLFDECIQLVTLGDGSSNRIRKDPETAFDMTSKDVALLVKCSDWSKLVAFTLFLGTNISNTFEFNPSMLRAVQALPNDEWCWVSVSFADKTTNLAPNRAALDWVQLSVTDDGTEAVTFQWNALAGMPQKAAGTIIITFDDGPANTFTEGFTYMNRYGMRGVAGPIYSTLGAAGNMTDSQLQQLQAAGWDIVWHGSNTVSWDTLTQPAIEKLCKAGLKAFADLGYRGISTIFTPGGSKTQNTLLAIRKFFNVGRVYTEVKMTQPPSNWNGLHVGAGIINTDAAATINTDIDNAMTENALYILAFHNITAAGASTFEYSIANFRTIIDHINTQGYSVKTISEFMAGL